MSLSHYMQLCCLVVQARFGYCEQSQAAVSHNRQCLSFDLYRSRQQTVSPHTLSLSLPHWQLQYLTALLCYSIGILKVSNYARLYVLAAPQNGSHGHATDLQPEI